MRQYVTIVVVATPLTATVVDVVVAGVKTATVSNHYQMAPAGGVAMAVPIGMKSIPNELLPQ
jgi:hypothetical protein